MNISPLRQALGAHLGQVLTPELACAIESKSMLSFSLHQTDKAANDIYRRLLELLGDARAVEFIRDLTFVVHVWDDLVDGDVAVSPHQVTEAFTRAIVGFGSNPFYLQNAGQLVPVLRTGILNWLGANQLEAIGTSHALQVSHVIRCSVGDVAVLCSAILNGEAYAASTAAELRMLMQQDSLEDYVADFHKSNQESEDVDSVQI